MTSGLRRGPMELIVPIGCVLVLVTRGGGSNIPKISQKSLNYLWPRLERKMKQPLKGLDIYFLPLAVAITADWTIWVWARGGNGAVRYLHHNVDSVMATKPPMKTEIKGDSDSTWILSQIKYSYMSNYVWFGLKLNVNCDSSWSISISVAAKGFIVVTTSHFMV